MDTINSLTAIGYLASMCLIVCGIPLAIESYKTKQSRVNPGFLFLWYAGELLGSVYAIGLLNGPMMLNYLFNLAILSVVVYYYINPGKIN